MLKRLMALGLLAAVIGITGCNTMRGMGQDIETAGDKIEDTAERAKN
jgi:predicted small secreted protein